MTDSDKIYHAINSLRNEIMSEFGERRKHVDEEFRRVHDRIDEVHERIEPLQMFTSSRNFFWRAVGGFLTICAAIGAAVVAGLKLLGG